MLKIDNKRPGNITLAGGPILAFGLNEVPDVAAKANEQYLNALHEAGDIVVVAYDPDEDSNPFDDPDHDDKGDGPKVGDPVLDDEGKPTYDEDGNPILYVSAEEQV